MAQTDLSPEQARVLDPDIRVVEAGPGAGKTRALVARYLQSATCAKRGVGLISFTNAAVDEVRARAHGRVDLLQAPNFVGTIDSFLHRFIVTPSEVPRLGKLPSYLGSWDDLPTDLRQVHLWDVPGSGVRLSRFRVDEAGVVTLDLENLRWDERNYVKEVSEENASERLMELGRAKILGLCTAGVFDASAARVKAFAIVEGADGSSVIDRLALRFEEVLVDEAQDCDGPEFSIIERLSSHVTTVVVADPDQAIFEFRGSVPKLFLEYRDKEPEEARCELTINYRSSPAICQTVSSLRAAGQSPIEAAEGVEGCPVYVLTGSDSDQRDKFRALLLEHAIAPEDAMVLAHKWSTAFSAAGRTPMDPASQAAGNMLAMACSTISKSTATASERLSAVRKVEGITLNLIDWPDALRAVSKEQQLTAISRTSEWLRIEAGKVVNRLRGVSDATQFGALAREEFGRVLHGLALPPVSLSNRVQKPSSSVWEQCNSHLEEGDALVCSSIHGAKGHEYVAVMVALPSSLPKTDGRDVLDEWEGDYNTEQRRVLYVACSRPERLLAFGAGSNSGRLQALLEAKAVTVDSR